MRNIHILTIAAMTLLSASAAPPRVSIPFTSNPPDLQADAQDNAWREAAIVRHLLLKGSNTVPDQRTEFRLLYDNDNL